MDRLKIIILILLSFILISCSVLSGGGSYRYEHYNPATNATIKVVVHSTREVGSAVIHFSPDGAVDVDVQSIKPGPNNMVLIPMTLEQLGKILIAVP